ncbi:hypothetical protein C2857_001543 [Epichloe festucae Fl1]|uniref:F-box domain-containing protein n=1 Tax=Epichloe festucae (strain Fl1) TaxID=877507 RepID=A0A7S9PRT4_EPIFF|nr:hypothetical protein C2857_001543 [Epichloe festucae Fl1]
MSFSSNHTFLSGWKKQLYRPKDYLAIVPTELKCHITSYLSLEELGRLGQCSKDWWKLTNPELYTRDAKEGNSYAIKWAACTRTKRGNQFAIATMTRSVMHGGQVNAIHKDFPKQNNDNSIHYETATAIHYAVAFGNRVLVNWLLDMGANLEIPCSGKDWALNVMNPALLIRQLGRFAGFYPGVAGYGLWLPLFVAFLQNNVRMARLLIQRGAPGDATHSTRNMLTRRTISILHFAAANNSTDFEMWKPLFNVFGNHINERCTEDLHTPLHVAMRSGNIKGMEAALEAGAIIEERNLGNHTPLVEGVLRLHWIASNGPARQQHITCLKQLVERGANVNPVGDSVLVPAIRYYRDNAISGPDMRHLIHFFLDSGADVNASNTVGSTPMRELCAAIFAMERSPAASETLKRLLKELVKRGADLSQTLPGNLSYLNVVLHNRDARPAWLYNFLWKNGATIQAHEADLFFLAWCQIPRLHTKRQYNIWQHTADISMPAIERAYKLAFESETPHLYNILRRSPLPSPTYYFLVRVAFNAAMKWSWRKILGYELASGFVTAADDHLENLVHLTVRVYSNLEDYSALEASKDISSLVRRGANIFQHNAYHKNPLEMLNIMAPIKDDWADLREALENELEKASRQLAKQESREEDALNEKTLESERTAEELNGNGGF